MGKETNSLTLIDVLGPLAQSADSTQISPKKLRGGSVRVVTLSCGSNWWRPNAKVVSSTLTRTSIQKYFSPFFVSAFFCFFFYVFVCFLFCCAILCSSLVDFFFKPWAASRGCLAEEKWKRLFQWSSGLFCHGHTYIFVNEYHLPSVSSLN